MCTQEERLTLIFQSTPPARGATNEPMIFGDKGLFQSTPPARGATSIMSLLAVISEFQSTPPARGATTSAVSVLHVMTISIHAPREGGDFV